MGFMQAQPHLSHFTCIARVARERARRKTLNLSYGPKYRALQQEVLSFVRSYGHLSRERAAVENGLTSGRSTGRIYFSSAGTVHAISPGSMAVSGYR